MGKEQIAPLLIARWRCLVLVALLLLATAVRFHQLEVQSFWNDEGNSARLSERSLQLIIEGTASDIHPPLYYLILRGWRELLGESEFSLRASSAFAGVMTVAVTFALVRTVAAQKGIVSVVAAGLAAVNPALVYYSQETRMYALLALLALFSTLLLWRWRQSAIRSQWSVASKRLAVAYILCAVAGLYTHYFFPAVLIAHSLLVLPWRELTMRAVTKSRDESANERMPPGLTLSPFRLIIHWAAMMGTTFLLYLPWLPIFLLRAGGRPAVRVPALQFLQDIGRWLAFGPTIQPETVVTPLIAVWLLLLLGIFMGGWRAALPLVCLMIPALFMLAVGATQPEFFKFMLVAAPFFCWLLALGVGNWGRGAGDWRLLRAINLHSPLSTLLLLVALWGIGRSLHNLYTDPAYARADYRGMAARITADAHPNAGIILDAPNQWEVFTYYHHNGAPVYPLPRGGPDPTKLTAELTDIAARHERIYAIFWGEAQRDPERLVERWLDEHAFKATDEWVGDVRFVVYAVPAEPAAAMATTLSTQFGDAITLNGYTLHASTVTPGDILQVTLFWETAESLTQRYKVFLHLVSAPGQPPIAQRDSEPGGSLIPTTIWQPGQIVVDNHGVLVPPDTPSGAYQLLLGLYDLGDPAARLPVQTEEGVHDALLIATIQVGR